jgi:hypothetical protein
MTDQLKVLEECGICGKTYKIPHVPVRCDNCGTLMERLRPTESMSNPDNEGTGSRHDLGRSSAR